MKPTIKRIHVNQHNIKANAKEGLGLPVLTIKNRGETLVGDSVYINGPSTVVYSPDKPLSCGARVWIETHADLVINLGKLNEVGVVG